MPIDLDQVEGMCVVFVDRIVSPPRDILDGVERARRTGSEKIVVITHRFQFTEDDLDMLGNLAIGIVMRVFVTHSYRAHEARMEEWCPGLFMPMPHVSA